MSELEFPTLEDSAPVAAPGTAVATQAGGGLDLEKFDLSKLALSYFGPWRAEAAAVKAKFGGLVLDLPTPSKIADARSLVHREVAKPIAAARATTEALKGKLNGAKGDVTAELALIVAEYDDAAKPIRAQIDAAEAKIAAEKEAARLKEEARVKQHRDNLAKLAEPAERCRQPGMTAERIANGIAAVSAIVIDRKAWEEFADQAEEQKAVTLERMRALHAEAVASEEAARRAAEERAEQERRAAELQAEADRLAAERAEIERARAELAAAQAAAAAKARQEEEARAAEAAAQAQRDAEAARIASEAGKAAAPGFMARKPLPQGVIAGATVNDSGQWYAADGTFMNPDGTRSIFDDVDEDSEFEFAPATTVSPEQGSQQVLKAEAPAPDATERDTPASQGPSVGSMGAGQPTDVGPALGVSRGGYIPFGAHRVSAVPATAELPTMTLGALNARLGFTVSADFLESLGFVAHRDRASRLYRPSDLGAICAGISAHVLALPGSVQQAA